MPRNVQPRIFTPERLQQLVEVYQQQPFTPTRTFAAQYECTTETVRQALKRAGYKHRRPARKIQLTEVHKAARVRFARDYRDFNFSNAIFSDEKSFTSNQQGRRHLWRLNNTRYEPQNVIPNNESGRIVVNMWGWMSSSGPGELVYIPERANGTNYLELLQETMVPTVRSVYPQDEVPEILFIQDNCPIHTSRVVRNWLEQQPDIRTVPWPSRSPDLNPIENLWGIMVQKWDNRNERTKENLVAHVDRVWEGFCGSNLCEVLVNSMRH
ncbi:hypothetical protein PYW07_010399 [Mythimna separata]|uniref:Transposase n=1 Tax=Mythimna separata TaxID=271217 RepID=A0AAD7YAB2_MYTSE|nr:hypothetical protein PYW07_010399 [Mythimna separata]